MYFRQRHRTHHKHDKGRLFAWMALITGIGVAAFWTVFPLITNSTLGSEEATGVFFTIVSLIVFAGSLLSTVVLQRLPRVQVTRVCMIGGSLMFILLALTANLWALTAVEMVRAVLVLFVGITISLYVRDFAEDANLGLVEGRYYLFANIGWLIGPLIGGLLAQYVSRNAVLVFAGVLYLLAYVLFEARKEHIPEHNSKPTIRELLDTFRTYLRDPQLRRVSAMSLGLNYWWNIAAIYIPIYIVANGFSDAIVGLVLAGGVVPLILMEGWVGRQADRHGLRKFFILGFVMLGIILFFFSLPQVILVLLLMVLSSAGMAFVEPLQEVYFFHVIDTKDEEKMYGLYDAAQPLASIISPLIGAGLILIGGLDALWIGSAVLMLIFGWIATGVRY